MINSQEIYKLQADIKNKVEKIEGKGLSSNDFTAEEKTKLSGINPNLYATTTQLTQGLNGKAERGHSHSDFSALNHTHSDYALSNHPHSEYAQSGHAHNEYASSDHSHNNYANSDHTHDYADSNHAHDWDSINNKPTLYNTWVGTQAQYDAISVKDPDTLYHITI